MYVYQVGTKPAWSTLSFHNDTTQDLADIKKLSGGRVVIVTVERSNESYRK